MILIAIMCTTTIIVTLALLLDFFKSKIQHKYPKINESCFNLKSLGKHKRPGERNKVKTVLTEFLRENYPECVQPKSDILSYWTQKLTKTGECTFDLDSKTAEKDDDSDYECENCLTLESIIADKDAESANKDARIADLETKLAEEKKKTVDQVATKLNSLSINFSLPWVIVAIQAFLTGTSHRQLHGIVSLLKASCTELKNIKVPSESWLYDQRFIMPGILRQQTVLWIYILKPNWQVFARPDKMKNTKSNLVKLRDTMAELQSNESPFIYITNSDFQCIDISDINETVASDFVNQYLPDIPKERLRMMKDSIKDIAQRIQKKINDDWQKFLDTEHEEHEMDFELKSTNADVESSFRAFKDSRNDANLRPEVAILKARCSYNLVIEWLSGEDDMNELVMSAMTKENRLENRREVRVAAQEHKSQLLEAAFEPATYEKATKRRRITK